MNSLYVTVSIPLLLVLAGFNAHAHGLTTFGKSNNQQQNPPTSQHAASKPCSSQLNCTSIKGTTCIKHGCLCGDNRDPFNGLCRADKQGHNHICQNDTECVDGATCKDVIMKPTNIPVSSNDMTMKLCQCYEGAVITPTGKCGGESLFRIFNGLIPIMIFLTKLY